MPRFFGFDPTDVERNRPDGDPDWDPPHLRRLYQRAEALFAENNRVWRPQSNAHCGLIDTFAPYLLALRPGDGDAVERHQLFIDAMLLLEGMYMGAELMPLQDTAPIKEVMRIFRQLPGDLQRSLHGQPFDTQEQQLSFYRRMVRISLYFISAQEVTPNVVGSPVDLAELPNEYSFYVTGIRNELQAQIRGSESFGQGAKRAADLLYAARKRFLVLEKLGDADLYPLDE